ncbi:MAG: FtsX-like permease family protein [Candidatus Pacearchaeota archaeon]|nr:FtsX-like permease family protein [Candidatus Pacearchaeota archaeon]
MEIFKYILKNIIKRPVRASFIIVAGLLAGLVMIFSFSLGLRVTENNKKDIIAKLTGHLWVPSNKNLIEFKEEYRDRYAQEAEIIRNYLGNHPNTEALIGWYSGYHEIQAGNKRIYALITGTDFEKDALYRERTELVEGTFPSLDESYSCLITTGLSQKYNLKLGDSVVLFIPSAFGARNAMDFIITGISRPSAPYYEGISINISDCNEMAELTGISPYYKAYVKDEKLISQMVTELKSKLIDIPVEAYTDDSFIRSLLASGMSTIVFFGGMAMILFFALLIGINSVIMTNIFDRRDEIGTLRALGFQRSTVRNIFFGETVMQLLIGYILGALLVAGLAVIYHIEIVRPPLLVLQYFFGMTRMGLTINFYSLVIPFLILFGIMTLSTTRTIGKESEKQAVSQMANR